jgi:hypothetical protein
VLLELWFEGHALKLVGKVVKAEARRARIAFSPTSAASAAELDVLVRGLPELPPPLPGQVIEPTDDEATVIAAMAEDLLSKTMRLEDAERMLARMRRRALTLEELLLPVTLAS